MTSTVAIAAPSIQTRDARQTTLIPPLKLAATHAVVVGVGAVGRQVSLMLASMGIPSLTLIDPDTVEVVNLGPQAYAVADVGAAKVAATAASVKALHPEIQLTTYQERFRQSGVENYLHSPLEHRAIFCCVDSMEARKFLWESLKAINCTGFWADSRAAGETLRALAASNIMKNVSYEKTLFRDEEAYAGSCTARMTIYLAAIAAGFLVAQFSKWLRDHAVEPDLLLDLFAGELAVLPPQ